MIRRRETAVHTVPVDQLLSRIGHYECLKPVGCELKPDRSASYEVLLKFKEGHPNLFQRCSNGAAEKVLRNPAVKVLSKFRKDIRGGPSSLLKK